MKSEEIAKRIGELEAEKKNLEKELFKTIEEDEAERKKALFDNSKVFILKLWEIYWKGENNSEALKRLEKGKEQWFLDIWIESDVKSVLKKTKMSAIDRVRELIAEYGVKCDVEECMRDARTRLDFAAALKSVRSGSDLSGRLGYSFDPSDLMELMRLHRGNKFRKKIEDLLTSCNYHGESGLLCSKKYDEYEKLVKKDCA